VHSRQECLIALQAAYLRSNFVEERRKLMQSWADFVLTAG
jgi:hypothetical protein